MARHPQQLPASLGREFSVAQARREGVGASRLLLPDLERPFRGARMVPSSPVEVVHDESPIATEARLLRAEIVRRARALATIARDGWFFSHVTAAVLWGLPVPLRAMTSRRRRNPCAPSMPRACS